MAREVYLDGMKCIGATKVRLNPDRMIVGACGPAGFVTMPVHDSAGNVIRHQEFEGGINVIDYPPAKRASAQAGAGR